MKTIKDVLDLFYLTKKYFEISKYEKLVQSTVGNRLAIIQEYSNEIIDSKLKFGVNILDEFTIDKFEESN